MASFEVPLTTFCFSEQISNGFVWNFQQQFFSVLTAGTIGFFVSMLFAPANDSEHRRQVDQFFKTMKTPIDFAKEVGEENDLSQLGVIGRFGLAISVFVFTLLLIPNPLEGRMAIVILAFVIGTLSLLMIKAGGIKTNTA